MKEAPVPSPEEPLGEIQHLHNAVVPQRQQIDLLTRGKAQAADVVRVDENYCN